MAILCLTSRRRRQYATVGAIYVLCLVAYLHENPSSLRHRYVPLTEYLPAIFMANPDHGIRRKAYTTTHLPMEREETDISEEHLKRSITNQRENEHDHHGVAAELEEWRRSPFFVVSLPGSGIDTTHRYFQCGLGGADHDDRNTHTTNNHKELLANYWMPQPGQEWNDQRESDDKQQMEIGRCMQQNVLADKPPLQGCGDSLVWSNVGYMASPDRCYFPTLHDGGLEAIVKAYPRATFLNVVLKSPDQWIRSLSTLWQTKLTSWCKFGQDSIVPSSRDNATTAISQREWKKFYLAYQERLRQFAKEHPTVKYVEVYLDDPETAQILHGKLGISKGCWQSPHHSALSSVSSQQQLLLESGKMMKIPTPVLVASLPKSGTTSTQRYFQCGLGYFEAAHHWTRDPKTRSPLRIGKCMHHNLQQEKPLFEGCGKFQVWTDTGYVEETGTTSGGSASDNCFYPSLHPDGLEAFYQSYPNATIMNVVRKADDWYDSVSHPQNNLLERWSQSSCQEFPAPGSSQDEWKEFYDHHTERIRYFAKSHPSLTYIEVDLESDDTGHLLEDQVGIPASCWGNCQQQQSHDSFCHVLHQMRAEEARRRNIRNALAQAERNLPPGTRTSSTSDRDLKVKDKWADYERQFQQLAHIPVQISRDPKQRKQPLLKGS